MGKRISKIEEGEYIFKLHTFKQVQKSLKTALFTKKCISKKCKNVQVIKYGKIVKNCQNSKKNRIGQNYQNVKKIILVKIYQNCQNGVL